MKKNHTHKSWFNKLWNNLISFILDNEGSQSKVQSLNKNLLELWTVHWWNWRWVRRRIVLPYFSVLGLCPNSVLVERHKRLLAYLWSSLERLKLTCLFVIILKWLQMNQFVTAACSALRKMCSEQYFIDPPPPKQTPTNQAISLYPLSLLN